MEHTRITSTALTMVMVMWAYQAATCAGLRPLRRLRRHRLSGPVVSPAAKPAHQQGAMIQPIANSAHRVLLDKAGSAGCEASACHVLWSWWSVAG